MPEIKTHPYTFDQLKYFQKEIEEAGGVDEFMFKKEYRIVKSEGNGGTIAIKELTPFGVLWEYIKFFLNFDRKIHIKNNVKGERFSFTEVDDG